MNLHTLFAEDSSKEDRRQYLNKLNDLNDKLSQILVGKLESDEAKLISKREYLDVLTNSYSTLAVGIQSKALKDPQKTLTAEETKTFGPYLKDIDFTTQNVFLVMFEDNGKFGPHYHDTDETIIVAKGGYRDGVTGKEYKEGDKHYIPAYTPHSFEPLSEGLAIVTLLKEK